MSRLSYPLEMEIAGTTAMWTRPDSGDCPVSYPAPTYSAVKAIFESVLWGPAIEINPIKVELCKPVQYHSYSTNYGGPLRSNEQINTGNNYQLFATVLIDVCYKLYAEVRPNRSKKFFPENAEKWDKKTTSPGHAYQSIFNRRLEHGQCYSIPFLGWREFTPSYWGKLRNETKAVADLPDLLISSMLRQVFSTGYNSRVNYSFDNNLIITRGVLCFPQEEY